MEAELQTQETPRQKQRLSSSDNTVYIGKKGVMNYVIAVVTQFNNGLPEVNVKARGKSISRAVDVTQIVKNRFIPTVKIADIQLSTEELMSEDGRNTKVSSIEIKLSK
ncbi:DNA-binding protein Alba [Candidatus Micrarchaeota archaeon]|nr:DNA-binding protein Alba [Candidatus Micrarchaeota archaeon]